MLATIGLETMLTDEMECNVMNIKRYFGKLTVSEREEYNLQCDPYLSLISFIESSNRILSNLQHQKTKQRRSQQQQQQQQQHDLSIKKSKRFSRADVISHFPFMDEFGGVEEIFQEETEKISALALDEINLRHYIEKIFNEFKIGSKGMRSADIPSALEVCFTRLFCFYFLKKI